MQTHPRHLGLARRQSYDPLSTTKSHSLSLGTLPSPSFGALPHGHTSVPAIESNRFLSGGFRAVFAGMARVDAVRDERVV